MLDSASASTIALLAAASTLLIAAMLYPTSLLRWLQRKRYQYEVTFSLYMLTSTEKFILSTSVHLPPSARHSTSLTRDPGLHPDHESKPPWSETTREDANCAAQTRSSFSSSRSSS
jgi:hypothetical protein